MTEGGGRDRRRTLGGGGDRTRGRLRTVLGRHPDYGRLVDHAVAADLLEREQDHGDVVAAAGLVGLVDQPGGGRVEVGLMREDLRDLVLGDHRREPVAAEHHDVAGAPGVGPGVDLDLGVDSKRTGDDRTLRVLGGLLLGQLAALDELADQRVVLGQQLELAVAEQIRAAVADVSDGDLGAIEVDRGQRRPHPRALVLGARDVVDAPVGGLHDRGQALLGAALFRQVPLKGFDRDSRGDLAGLRAAHSVGDHEQRRARERAVLVAASLATRIGPPCRVRCPQHHWVGGYVIAGTRIRSRRSGFDLRRAAAAGRSMGCR